MSMYTRQQLMQHSTALLHCILHGCRKSSTPQDHTMTWILNTCTGVVDRHLELVIAVIVYMKNNRKMLISSIFKRKETVLKDICITTDNNRDRAIMHTTGNCYMYIAYLAFSFRRAQITPLAFCDFGCIVARSKCMRVSVFTKLLSTLALA
eukprot:scpid89196/ scgid19477/ 